MHYGDLVLKKIKLSLCFSFFSEKFIAKGEEITIDYSGGGDEHAAAAPIECKCGSKNCKKTIY